MRCSLLASLVCLQYLQYSECDLGRLEGKVTYSIAVYPSVKKRFSRSSKRYTPKSYLDQTLRKAVAVWDTVLPGKFKEGSNNTTIKVMFYSKYHDDSYPFDGMGGEVAHSYFPSEIRRGEIHIDADEPWGPGGRNLHWVLAHEIGHSLGIPHLPSPALMAQDYQGYLENQPRLYPNDLQELKILYNL